MDLERVVVGRSATRTKTFTFTPTGTPTVDVRRSDGTAVTVGSVTGAATEWTYTIPSTSLTELDKITETWTAVSGGVNQEFVDYIEVAGGYLFSLDELEARLTDTTATYTDAQLADARTYAETEIEREINIALVPRFGTYRGGADGYGSFRIPVYGLRAIRWVNTYTAGVATAYSASQLLALELGEGTVYGGYWPAGYRNVEVGFEHGLDTPPPGAKEACLVLAEQHIVQGPIDDRATQRASEFGPVNLATPGMFGSRFGIPVVDAFCTSARIPAVA
jgi:hypothetical protein